MKETKFIDQNKKKWREFERILDSKKKDPDKLSNLFIQITDDLSYSRTFYPNRSVRVYLNYLAQKIFNSVYENRKSKVRTIIRFWKDELPQIMFEARKDLLFAFLVFLFAFAIGAVSTYMNPDFPSVILGDSYVNMTIENIEDGDPMRVYKNDNELLSSLQITINNLRVSFFTFVGGVFFMIGTLGVMLYNGIMLGAFQTFFAMQDSYVFKESLLTIWIHGTLEISAIILAGAAGITMGKGLVFPNTYTRMQAFQISARRGVKMMLGIFPIFIIAGFIEGFITRHTDTPDIIRLFFIILCFLFVIIYYVIYPYRKGKRGFVSDIHETKLVTTKSGEIDFLAIKSNGSITTETFSFFRKHLTAISKIAVISSLLYVLILLSVYGMDLPDKFLFRRWTIMLPPSWYIHGENIGQLFDFTSNPLLLLILNTLIFSAIIYLNLNKIAEEKEQHINENWIDRGKFVKNIRGFAQIILIVVSFQLGVKYTSTLLLILLPFVMLWMSSLIIEEKNLFTGFKRSIQLMKSSFFNTLGLGFMLSFIIILFSFISNTEITWYLLDVLGWNFANRIEIADTFLYSALIFLFLVSIGFFLPILTTSYAILYYSLIERTEAVSLREKVKNIGKTKKVFGLERENSF